MAASYGAVLQAISHISLPAKGIADASIRNIILLHPLLSFKESWRLGLNRLRAHSARRYGWETYALDARNHGESPWTETHDYAGMVADLKLFMDSLSPRDSSTEVRQNVLVGHSQGGKLAMLYALLFPEQVHRLFVIDAAPAAYTHSHDSLFPVSYTHLTLPTNREV